jgi:hypothetical protein
VPTESVYNFNVFHVFQSYTNGHDERYNDGSYADPARRSPRTPTCRNGKRKAGRQPAPVKEQAQNGTRWISFACIAKSKKRILDNSPAE